MSKFFFSCHKIHILFHRQYCGRKEDSFQGPRMGSCLTLGNKLPEEIHVLTKQETLLGRGAWAESRRLREPRRTALHHGHRDWHLLSPFDLFQILQVGGNLLVLHSLQGPPVVRYLESGYYRAWPGREVLVTGSHNSTTKKHGTIQKNKKELCKLNEALSRMWC